MSDQKPSIGRIVHYVSYGTPGAEYKSECRAAIITEVSDAEHIDAPGRVGLCVLNPTGIFFRSLADGGCLHDEAGARGCWVHWPERV
jgi:hypothetical protein